MSTLTDYFQVAAHIVTILGLPLAIFLYYQEKKKGRRDREYGTYNALDDKYIQFLDLKSFLQARLNWIRTSLKGHLLQNQL